MGRWRGVHYLILLVFLLKSILIQKLAILFIKLAKGMSHQEQTDMDSQHAQEHSLLNENHAPPAINHRQRSCFSEIINIIVPVCLCLFLICFIVAVVTLIIKHKTQPIVAENNIIDQNYAQANRSFPKILWVLCGAGGIDGLPMMESVVARHQVAVGKAGGYDVRVVDAITAYDWLPPHITELIRRAKHTTQFHIPVEELLRIALLIEHGGVSANVDSIIFNEKLDWIEEMFNANKQTLRRLQEDCVIEYCKNCDAAPELVLFRQGSAIVNWFDVGMLMARPGSKLLRELFQEMLAVLERSRRSYDAWQNFGWYTDDKTISIQNYLYNLLSFRSHYWNTGVELCRDYGVLAINRKEGSFMRTLYDWPRIAKQLLMDRQQLFEEEGYTKVFNVDLKALRPQIMELAKYQTSPGAHPKSIFREIVETEDNQWLLKPIDKTRNVSLCIISLKPLPQNDYEELVAKSTKNLANDKFRNWEAVYFVQGLSNKMMKYSADGRIKLVNASEWQGLNLQRAATQYCPPSAIAVLLDYDESFTDENSLGKIARQFQIKDYFAAFLSVQINQKVLKPNSQISFRNITLDTHFQNLKEISNNLRVFSLYAYRLVARFELHDQLGRYFNREVPFNIMLQMETRNDDRCENTEIKFHIKHAESKGAEIPRKRAYLPEVVIQTPEERTPDFSRFEYKGKNDAYEWCESLEQYYERIKSSLNGFFVLNNGTEFQGMQNRKDLPKLIPNVIHQIWIGNSPLPKYKQALMESNKRQYPNYEYILWSNQNITRENFPQTYDIIQALLQFNKHSPTDKMAMISDLMRLEILYQNGGFYFDTNYYFFRPGMLDDWRTFEDVIAGQLIPFYRFQRENSLLGCIKGSARFKRLLDHRRLSTRNFFSRWANMESGPAYLAFAILGQEELSPTIYQPPFEHVFPWFYNSNDPNACEAPEDTPPQQLLLKNKKAYWKNCSQFYKQAFGIQFFLEGGSWIADRK